MSREQFDRDVSSMIMQDTSNVHEVVVDKYTTSVRHHSSNICLLSKHPMHPRFALEFEPFYLSHIYVSTMCNVTFRFFLKVSTATCMCESRGSRGSEPPPPPEKSQNIGFLSDTGPDHNLQASIQCWATIDQSAKRHLNVVTLAGR